MFFTPQTCFVDDMKVNIFVCETYLLLMSPMGVEALIVGIGKKIKLKNNILIFITEHNIFCLIKL